MDIKVTETLISNCQNLGSHEDIITGILATIFEYCPTVTKELLTLLSSKEYAFWEDENDYNYYCGMSLTRQNEKWLDGKINFRPDLLIKNLREWEENGPESKEKFFLIESKLWTKLSDSQIKGYSHFKDNYKSYNIYISMSPTEDEMVKKCFNRQFTWNNVTDVLAEILHQKKSFKDDEKSIAENLLTLMKSQMTPDLDGLKEKGKEKFAPEKLLDFVKWRLHSNVRKSRICLAREDHIGLMEFNNFLKKECAFKKDALGKEVAYFRIFNEYYLICVVNGTEALFVFEKENYDCDQSSFELLKKISLGNFSNEWFGLISDLQEKIKSDLVFSGYLENRI